MFKTRLDNFGNDFGHLWNFEIFLIFWKHFEDSTLHGTLGKKNFRKHYPKTCSKHVWTLLGTTLGFCAILKNFDFLRSFRRLDPTWNTGQKKTFRKVPQNMFKALLDNLGTILGVFGFLKVFWFFENISKTRPSMEHWAKNFLSKILTENMFKTRLDNFGNDFGHLCNFENFLIFWKHFEDSTLHGTLGKKKIEKITPKHVQNTFGHFWQRLWAFLRFWNLFNFF